MEREITRRVRDLERLLRRSGSLRHARSVVAHFEQVIEAIEQDEKQRIWNEELAFRRTFVGMARTLARKNQGRFKGARRQLPHIPGIVPGRAATGELDPFKRST